MTPKWIETTDDRYWQMLEMLPPACHRSVGFLVGEPYDHARCTITGLLKMRYTAFARVGSPARIFEADRPMTIPEFQRVTADDVLENIGEARGPSQESHRVLP